MFKKGSRHDWGDSANNFYFEYESFMKRFPFVRVCRKLALQTVLDYLDRHTPVPSLDVIAAHGRRSEFDLDLLMIDAINSIHGYLLSRYEPLAVDYFNSQVKFFLVNVNDVLANRKDYETMFIYE